MAKETPAQKAVVDRVLHAFKEGTLESGSGDRVTDRHQAVAIGLSEAGISREASPASNRRNRRRSANEAEGATRSKAELYAEAKQRSVPGRSTMTKAALARALA